MNRVSFLRSLGILGASTVISAQGKTQVPERITKEILITKFRPEKFIGPYNKRFRCDVYKITEILKMTQSIQTCLNNKSLDLNEVYAYKFNEKYGLMSVREPLQLDGAYIECKAELIREKEDYLPYFNSIDPSLFSERDMRDYEYQKTQINNLL